eukprot:5078931-Prymnesium_polylepis.1
MGLHTCGRASRLASAQAFDKHKIYCDERVKCDQGLRSTRGGLHKNRVAEGPGLTSSTPLSKMTAAVRAHGEQLLSKAVKPAPA